MILAQIFKSLAIALCFNKNTLFLHKCAIFLVRLVNFPQYYMQSKPISKLTPSRFVVIVKCTNSINAGPGIVNISQSPTPIFQYLMMYRVTSESVTSGACQVSTTSPVILSRKALKFRTGPGAAKVQCRVIRKRKNSFSFIFST